MANDAIRAQYDKFFGADFMPLIRHDQTQGAPEAGPPMPMNILPFTSDRST